MPDVRIEDLYSMLVSSVRYAMGRKTYVVGETCDIVRRYRKHLREDQAMIIVRDIQRELDMVERMDFTLGHDQDHRQWKRLVVDLLGGGTDA